ncbi:MAG: DUF3108 domain-containing protein [Bacteroidales bacterium]|nr:DUF3108 domain-containing protein [Bacteroidales bacterium]MCF8387494.1 DUF3108 domain-containing protein [Bacteroidales bacterium]MCF8398435.1 DUF3108 domain-containing protein [Bacteroidales bacterium]
MNKLKDHLLLILLLLAYLATQSQCIDTNKAFREGEQLKYQMSYQWGFIWIRAGEVYFKVDRGMYKNRDAYHFTATGGSLKKIDWLFKVREHLESRAAVPDLKPMFFVRNSREMGFLKYNSILFDDKTNEIYTKVSTSKNLSNMDTLQKLPCTYDVITAAYVLRNLDYDNLKPGDSLQVHTILDNRAYNFLVKYSGRETARDASDEEYNCIKLSAILEEGTLFKSGESLTIWVTDDENKLPVKAEAEILIGKVNAFLVSSKNLKHPEKAKIQ